MNKKRIAEVDISTCVSCGACHEECPCGAISVFKGCYALVDAEKCVGCGICSRTCPASCITIKDR